MVVFDVLALGGYSEAACSYRGFVLEEPQPSLECGEANSEVTDVVDA